MGENKIEKEALLKSLAENGYNIGIGAKRHLKSYDILSGVPRLLSFILICIGIIQMTSLYKDQFSSINDIISVILIIAGIIALVADLSSENKEEFNNKGVMLIELFNELRDIYNQVQKLDDNDLLSLEKKRMREIVEIASQNSISRQIWFSNWWAHFGFFYEMQIDWINNELKFKFWRDKVPATLKFVFFMIIVGYIINKIRLVI
ncbi:SLATT domain-containing protein [Clostridium sp. YIM B02506]|uniref:SLATT domain-containing protein n=1 Tax=Clostridium sp. YIM B02506 TaxID=2910680 RepID=UPI001EEDD6F6|nr:SLATT domain-containing protein [Clostridium sp. YIM B02506]